MRPFEAGLKGASTHARRIEPQPFQREGAFVSIRCHLSKRAPKMRAECTEPQKKLKAAAGSGGTPFMGKGVLPNGPAALSLENHFRGSALQRIHVRGRTMGTAAGASQYEPSVAARAPTLLYAGASCFSTFPAPREVAGPLLWEKGSCQMGPQRRVWKITFMGPLYKELMHEAEPWGLRRGRASTSPQLPHGPHMSDST